MRGRRAINEPWSSDRRASQLSSNVAEGMSLKTQGNSPMNSKAKKFDGALGGVSREKIFFVRKFNGI
jgi:hypothetical protein